MKNTNVYWKYEGLPDHLKKEVEDFIDFLRLKSVKNNEIDFVEGEKKAIRTPGLAKGLIEMRDDFDAPLDGFNEYMYF